MSISGLAALAAAACTPVPGIEMICGPSRVEDLAQLPGTRWVVASGMHAQRGDLYLIDRRTRGHHSIGRSGDFRVAPDKRYPCAAPPKPERMVTHGLAVLPRGAGRFYVYAINHAEREAVEVFEIDTRRTQPRTTWIGCIEMPRELPMNSVAVLDPDTLFVTRLSTQVAPADRTRALASGSATGAILEWRRGTVTQLQLDGIAGPNGILVSRDGRHLFVSMFGAKQVVRYDRTGAEPPKALPIASNPDNLRWTDTGLIAAAGAIAPVGLLLDCLRRGDRQEFCSTRWEVPLIDPATMRAVETITRDTPGFGDVTTAMQVGDELWIGTIGPEDKVAILSHPAKRRRD